jgi:hypothetical protein
MARRTGLSGHPQDGRTGHLLVSASGSSGCGPGLSGRSSGSSGSSGAPSRLWSMRGPDAAPTLRFARARDNGDSPRAARMTSTAQPADPLASLARAAERQRRARERRRDRLRRGRCPADVLSDSVRAARMTPTARRSTRLLPCIVQPSTCSPRPTPTCSRSAAPSGTGLPAARTAHLTTLGLRALPGVVPPRSLNLRRGGLNRPRHGAGGRTISGGRHE